MYILQTCDIYDTSKCVVESSRSSGIESCVVGEWFPTFQRTVVPSSSRVHGATRILVLLTQKYSARSQMN
jgi:hypothetical protein